MVSKSAPPDCQDVAKVCAVGRRAQRASVKFIRILCAALTVCWGTRAFAADARWTNAAGGNWWTGANWSLGRAPTSSDTAIIRMNTGTISLNGHGLVDRLNLIGATTKFNLLGFQLQSSVVVTLENDPTQGNRASALTLENGRLITPSVAFLSEGQNSITVGSGARLQVTDVYHGSGFPSSNSLSGLIVESGGRAEIKFIDCLGTGGTFLAVQTGAELLSGKALFGNNTSQAASGFSPYLNVVGVGNPGSRWIAQDNIELRGSPAKSLYSGMEVSDGGLVRTEGLLLTTAYGEIILRDGGTIEANSFTSQGKFAFSGGTFRIDGSSPAPNQSSPGLFTNSSPTLTVAGVGGPVMEFASASDDNLETLVVGAAAGDGEVRIYDGSGLDFTNVTIGATAGSHGTLKVIDFGSAMLYETGLVVGNSGAGSMEIVDGAQVIGGAAQVGLAAGSTGTVTMRGAASGWDLGENPLRVGQSGNGTLLVSEGGRLRSSSGFIAYNSTSTSTATITGEGSWWIVDGPMYVGGNDAAAGGNGAVTVADGGMLGVDDRLRVWDTGSLTVDGGTIFAKELDRRGALHHHDGMINIYEGIYRHSQTGSALVINGSSVSGLPQLVLSDGAAAAGVTDYRVGDSLRGSLTIESGSDFAPMGAGAVGYQVGSSGVVTVRGVGSTLTQTSALVIGRQGTGLLTIQDGAAVANGKAAIGQLAGSSGAVVVEGAGSSWTISDALAVGEAGVGELKVGPGARVQVAGDMTIAPSGVVSGRGVIAGDVFNAGGIGGPSGTGVPRVEGDVHSEATAVLHLQLTTSTSFDALVTTGDLHLDGRLEIALGSGFVPSAGQAFDILDWSGAISGEFSRVDLPMLATGLAWDVRSLATTGVLSVAPASAADFDQDGDVDASDLARWQAGFSVSASPLSGNTDGDDDVDGADFLTWQRQLNAGSPSVATTTAVPEPASHALVLASVAALAGSSLGCKRPLRPTRKVLVSRVR